MKKLLGLLGTIMITGNAIPSVIAAAPNRKHSIKKRQNNENTSTTPKTQDDQQPQISTTSDSKVDIIEKEITLNENYSENIQKMLQELIDKNYIDPLRTFNMGGLLSSEFDNKTIISKLEELEPKMANWFKNQQNNKDKTLILTLKNSNNKSIKLVIRLENFYVLGFINNQNQYFNFKDEKIKQINDLENEITKLGEKTKQNATKYDKLQKNLAKAQIIQNINKTIIKKYDYQNINLNYTGDYNEEGLDVIIREEKIDKGKSILISKKTLNDAINKLAILEDENKQNKEIKDDLVRLIFATSETMRFQCDEKSLEIYAEFKNYKELTNEEIDSLKKEIDKKQKEKNQLKKEIKNIIEKNLGKKSNIIQLIKIDNWDQIINEIDSNIENTDELIESKKQIEKIKENEEKINEIKRNLEITELNKIIKGSKNILVDIQEKIFNKNQTITWSEYTTQLRGNKKEFGGWKDYSEMLNKFRIEIWEQLVKEIKTIDFLYKNKESVESILKNSKWEQIKNNNIDIVKLYEEMWENDLYILKMESYILNIIENNGINYAQNFLNPYINKKNKLNYDISNINNNNVKLTDNFQKEILKNIKILIKEKENKIFLEYKEEILNKIKNLIYILYFKKIYYLQDIVDLKKQNKNFFISNKKWFEKKLIKAKEQFKENIYFNYIDKDAAILFYSIMGNNLDIIKLLIKLNISEKTINSYFLNKNMTPLLLAINNDNLQIVKELLKNPKINVNITNENGDTPLNMASFNNNLEIVKELLNNKNSKDKIEVNKENNQKGTPLFYSVYNNNLEMVKELLNNNVININCKDEINNTPLSLAISNNNLEITKLLIKKGKELHKNKEFEELNKALFIAEKNNNSNSEIIKSLLNIINNNLREYYYNQPVTIGIKNQKNIKNENGNYDVPADNSCLFWAVSSAYLLPARNNNQEFKNRFIKLFGELQLTYLSYVQNLYKEFDLENHSSIQNLYQDSTMNRLIRDFFRSRVVDYTESHLDTIINHNEELTFRDLIQENNEVANNYLERMRESSTWGGTPEIIAITNILNANISVNNDAPYQPINQNSTNNINIFHVNNGTHYNFALLENVEVKNTNSQEKNTTVKNQQKLTETEQPKTNITISNKSTGNNNNNVPVPSLNKPININIANSQETTTKKAINKYNSLSKEEKQQKLNEINQNYQNLSENDKKVFKDKLAVIGTSAIGAGISAAGAKITISGSAASASSAAGSTGEAIEMTPLLSESLTAAETLSVAEGTAVVATEGAVIGAEAGTAAALAPETLGLSLVIGGLAIAGTAIIWWLSGHDSNTQAVKHESHNQYNEIEKYYKFLTHDQLKLDISINEWNKIKQIYKNANNYQEFKNQIKSEITNFHKEDHSGWGGSITDNDINTLINIIYNHFQEINNHFLSNHSHGWKIVTNTIGSYFIIEEE